jgi:hypothetical protein
MIRAALFFTFCLLLNSSFSQPVSAEASKNYVGKTVTVVGKVVDGRYLANSNRQPTLLNVDKPFPNQAFSIVIYGDKRQSFGYKPEEMLLNKNVLVTGVVEMYNGKPQMIVNSPDQIVIASANTDLTNTKALKTGKSGDVKLRSATKLRSGPGIDNKVIAKLPSGSIVHVLHSEIGWTYVSVTKGLGNDYTLNGFIKSEDLK